MKLTIRACLLINLISFQLAAFAQIPAPTFGKKEGQVNKYETAAGFDTDRDGAIYSAMNLNSGATIVKYSSSGAQVWKSVLTPTASYQDVEIKDLRVDTMRNVFVLGSITDQRARHKDDHQEIHSKRIAALGENRAAEGLFVQAKANAH